MIELKVIQHITSGDTFTAAIDNNMIVGLSDAMDHRTVEAHDYYQDYTTLDEPIALDDYRILYRKGKMTNQIPDEEVTQDPRVITWCIHPELTELDADARLQHVSDVVATAVAACGVDDYQQVIPAGWNNGVAGPLREKRGPKGDKHAYYPVSEMILHWGRITSGKPYTYRDLSACLYEAYNVLNLFS